MRISAEIFFQLVRCTYSDLYYFSGIQVICYENVTGNFNLDSVSIVWTVCDAHLDHFNKFFIFLLSHTIKWNREIELHH